MNRLVVDTKYHHQYLTKGFRLALLLELRPAQSNLSYRLRLLRL
jgi:hypothetical protein